ncbi:unnamed protein product [Closterium sp. NIES-64]|nr:unnamed protein product [Closterium sp. NIES-64]
MLTWITAAISDEEQAGMGGHVAQGIPQHHVRPMAECPGGSPLLARQPLRPPLGIKVTLETIWLIASPLTRCRWWPSTLESDGSRQAAGAEAAEPGDVVAATRGKEVEKDKRTFRPGWHNIFRMNQKELEAAIRRVSSDSSLDPREEGVPHAEPHDSRWIVAQQQQHKSSRDTPEEEVLRASYHDEEKGIYGCQHYRRNCKVRAVCCGKLVSCRFCHDKVADHAMDRWVHNTTRSPTMPWTGGFTTGQGRQPCHGQVGSQQDKVANHAMDRHAVKEMMCMKFLKVQPVGQHCATPSCNGYSMAKHYCSICKLFDDARDIYHCPFCNLCRVGRGLGIDYFHCMTCNACMSVTLAQHTCREKGLESNCPICHDFLFTSSAPVKALPCGHFMHSACFLAYTCEHYTCPICCKSVGDMRVYFGMLDALLAAEQLPEEYRKPATGGPSCSLLPA